MPLGGDPIDDLLRVVRVHIDALGESLEDALRIVPEEAREAVRARYEEEVAQPIRRTHLLSGSGGPRAWFKDWRPSEGYYWRRQRQYLLDELGRSESELDLLDDASDKVLSHLEDPLPSGPAQFRVVGLVLGYVQSGKTANYSALIAKAADLGYKFVIVLSGLHNQLRQQTQRRLARELGLEPGPPGVGLPEHGRRWVTLTKSEYHGDFRPGTLDPNVLQGNERVLAVVKKNATVLRRLVRWMSDRVPQDLPVLIVDDEADQASVNTGGNRRPLTLEDVTTLTDLTEDDIGDVTPEEELDPSVINGLIRDLVSKIQRVALVGYTATPFANVFIDPDAYDRLVEHDLYPRDFILSLYGNPTYFGTERLFGRDELDEDDNPVDGLDVIEIIPESDASLLLPPRGATTAWSPEMCDSLRTAIVDFILATAARVHRLGRDGISSMLIHTSHRIWVQDRMGDLLREELRLMRREWRYGSNLKPVMRQRWRSDFRPLIASIDIARDATFEMLEGHIDRLFDDDFRDGRGVIVLNSNSPDILDYEADPTQKLILIGGNRLSRGLTLENLLVSYYVREAQTYDTLLQMGRWFGHREGYVDLTRIWTTQELARRFRHLALVEEEVRNSVAIYERERLNPLNFGVRIRSHPAMLITAANKLGTAQRVLQSYAGERLQTTRFRLSQRDWLESNLLTVRSFLSGLGPPTAGEALRPAWTDISWEQVVELLRDYQTAQDAVSIDAGTVRRYIERQARRHGELTRWLVSIRSLSEIDAYLGTEDLSIQDVNEVACISRSRLIIDPDSIGALVSPPRATGPLNQGDEEFGLSDEQIERARDRYSSGMQGFPTLGHALRAERDPDEGLLLVYPISRFSQPRKNSPRRAALFAHPEDACTVIGLAFVFPPSTTHATVEYYVGAPSIGQQDEYDEG